MPEIKLCSKRNEILNTSGHILIEGGPGAGKTTIALLKAKAIIDLKILKPNQKILFLSFARATISRVEEQANNVVTKTDKNFIEINTYHGFSWNILKSYGYLLTQHRFFKLITPPNLSAMLAEIPEAARHDYKCNLLESEGIICFDLFAETVTNIFDKSARICNLISMAYPFIIVDEFQDTDIYEWKMIRLLGKRSTIIGLADLNQRIFEFRGASITRIPEFNKHFKNARFDLGIENNRSSNTDIVQFGDDLLASKNKGRTYKNVNIIRYPFYRDQRSHLKFALIKSITRVKKASQFGAWSIAILVKSKQDTLLVSTYLSSQNLHHEVLIDPSGPALSASIIAQMLEPQSNPSQDEERLIRSIITHIRGRKADKISKKDIELTKALETYLKTEKVLGSQRKLLIEEIKSLLSKRIRLQFVGIPSDDWLSVRKLFQDSKHEILNNVYEDARFLRLLNRGAILSETLSDIWRQNRNYEYASVAVDNALTQEHFSMTHRSWNGVFVMNMHKSKGKEFDEVIIWEELYKQIVPENANESRLLQARLILRVAITRSKSFTTILTPLSSPCILL